MGEQEAHRIVTVSVTTNYRQNTSRSSVWSVCALYGSRRIDDVRKPWLHWISWLYRDAVQLLRLRKPILLHRMVFVVMVLKFLTSFTAMGKWLGWHYVFSMQRICTQNYFLFTIEMGPVMKPSETQQSVPKVQKKNKVFFYYVWRNEEKKKNSSSSPGHSL